MRIYSWHIFVDASWRCRSRFSGTFSISKKAKCFCIFRRARKNSPCTRLAEARRRFSGSRGKKEQKCGIDKKPLTLKTTLLALSDVGKCFRRCFPQTFRPGASLCASEREREKRSRHEEWKWTFHATPQTQFSPLNIEFPWRSERLGGVGAVEEEFLQFYVRGGMSQTVATIASTPTAHSDANRVFLDRLLRYSTFSSCFPSTQATRTAPSIFRSRSVHDYIKRRRAWRWDGATVGLCVYNTCTLGIGLDTEKPEAFTLLGVVRSRSLSLTRLDRYAGEYDGLRSIKETHEKFATSTSSTLLKASW